MQGNNLVSIILFASATALMSASAVLADTLTILHTNDFHSRIAPISQYDGPCSDADNATGDCFGGWARLVSAVTAARKRAPEALLVDGGDQFQGSMFYTYYKGRVAAEMMNALGYDAMTVGNHEFDDGPEVLRGFMDAVDFPVLMSNADVSKEPALSDRLGRSTVVEKAGERYGLIGLTTEDTPELSSPGRNIVFTDSVAAVQREVDRLAEAGVNRIIVLSHSGYQTDLDVASRVTGVDVIVGGHSNTYLSSSDDSAEGPYPTVIGKTAVVQAYAYGKYLGELAVTFDDSGVITHTSGEPIIIDGKVAEDQRVLARIDELAEPFQALLAQVVGESTDVLEGGELCRSTECSMGNLVTDAMLDRVAHQGVTLALMNSGGIRASIDAGKITMGELLTVLPFQNTLSTFEIGGADLLRALENGVSQVETGSGRFLQVAGLSYAFDATRPAGERITKIMLTDGDQSSPLDPAATYTVVTNNYVRQGGDGYSQFADEAKNAYDYGPNLEDVVAEYLHKHGSYAPGIAGRITASH